MADDHSRREVSPPSRPTSRSPVRHEAAYRELFERSADALLVIDDDRFVDCNQATVALLRYGSKEELLRTHPSELSPRRQPDGRLSYEKANEMMAIAFERGSHRFEWTHVRADGEAFPVEVLLTAVSLGERTVLHCVWRDITERKQLERELRHAQKMEAIGKLAGGIAHDFNNLLQVVLGHADLLSGKLADDPELAEHLAEIRGAGGRAASLVGQLLAFGRKQMLQPQVVDLNRVVSDLQRMLGRVIGEDIRLALTLHREPLPIEADPDRITQVVLNLATNARDAMPGGGVLTVETGRRSPGRRAEGRGSGEATLVVSDTGEGMDDATAARVFEPFFTTKDHGKGTGLGLSTAYGIVKQSGGDIRVRSRPGAGSRFEIRLPLTTKPLRAPRVPTPVPGADRGPRGRILVVEDDDSVALVVVTVLRGAGHDVHHERDGEAALVHVERVAAPYDLLLTDVVMPGMGGPELARRLRERRPQLEVLYMSGYTDDALASRGVLDPDVELLAKPFVPSALREQVQRVLQRRGRSRRRS